MLKQARLSKILEVVNEDKYVSLQSLMILTGGSESTIRADLVELDKQGKLLRLRGGAQAMNQESTSYELSVEDKMGIQVEAKRAIALKAASFIPNNSVVYFDAGTSTYFLAEALSAKNITAVTNSVLIARVLRARGYKTYVLGGELKLSTDAFIGPMAQEIVRRFSFDVGFFGVNGVDLERGLSTPDVEEASIKRAAIACCKDYYFLADSSKFGTVTSVNFHPFEGQHIITEKVLKKPFFHKGVLEAKQ